MSKKVRGTSLDRAVGNALRQVRKKKGGMTQERYVDSLDLMNKISRSHYSMIEEGHRSASLELLDHVSEQEGVSFDFLFGIHNYMIDPRTDEYQELIEIWNNVNEADKKSILEYAKKIYKNSVKRRDK